MEGEQEGPAIVAQNLIGKAIRSQFVEYFPNPEDLRKNSKENPYEVIIRWFGARNKFDMLLDLSDPDYAASLVHHPPALEAVVTGRIVQPEAQGSGPLIFV
ncbi:MAG: hypothetical protein IPP17_30500 [Bacteroidetes bacterium]|nr:hypothetical protein [Bacteroidota bacterium]